MQSVELMRNLLAIIKASLSERKCSLTHRVHYEEASFKSENKSISLVFWEQERRGGECKKGKKRVKRQSSGVP